MMKYNDKIDNAVVDSYNECYKHCVAKISSITKKDYTGDLKDLENVKRDPLNEVYKFIKLINNMFSNDIRVSRIFTTVSSYEEMMKFCLHANKTRINYDNLLLEIQEQFGKELKVQMSRELGGMANFKLLINGCIDGLHTLSDIVKAQKSMKDIVRKQLDFNVTQDAILKNILPGTKNSLFSFDGTRAYGLLCRRFLRNEIDKHDGDAHISELESRVFGSRDSRNEYKVINIGIFPANCRLGKTSVMVVKGRHIKPNFVSPIATAQRVLKINQEGNGSFEVTHGIQIKTLLCISSDAI